ncbi:hypothetical protein CVU83_00825 [Candidatus Falkowbacteria bacterium HGW-Falkowbacteria-2]|uniref:Glycosyltransferase family 1 protein n=1 Tax=Candidatus Falkowbacteria bacterium HGW-Falkowbacteria-2 TaxID=2013769 RepID=A0A2N2E2Q9_9BACT|nr:MAG: hypothetical protein CVU83_00825 [Candidatus Falkowbacteria bacterium HGW-Falkowbacteria-2]
MKILLVNKFYYPNRGADKYFLFLEKLLRENGHEVRVFAMESPLNLPSPDSRYFSKQVDLHVSSLIKKVKIASKIIYNTEAKQKFSSLLADFKPDLIHCHNIYHQLSPSILEAATAAKIPVAMHLHDYKLICPNYRLYTKGAECRRCKKHNYIQCVKHRCIENSYSKSAIAALEMTLHHRVKHIYRDNVQLFIAPSLFMRDVCVDFGWSKEKFRVLENISPTPVSISTDKPADYFLYFGALEEEKGVDILLKAAAMANARILIAGEGKDEMRLKDLSVKLGVNVKFAGKLTGEPLKQAINEARAIVIPSRWPENMPLSGIEAMGLGKAVIAAKTGGLPELVKDGVNGLLFSVNNYDELSACLSRMTTEEALRMGADAQKSREGKDEKWHYQKLISIYEELIRK